LEDSTDARDPCEAWMRLPRIGALDPRSRAVARELAAWRERTAAAEDKPVGTIVQDVALVEVAKRRPKSIEALAGIRGLHGGIMKRRAQDMLAAIGRGEEAEPIPRDQRRSLTEPGDAPLIALAEALIRARTLAAGLAYELVASRAELDQIVAAARRGDPEPDVRPLQGWRREVVGEDLEAILTGRRALRVGAEGRLETIAALDS
jgi:ribonuclease D